MSRRNSCVCLALAGIVATASAQVTTLELGMAQDGSIEMTGQSTYYRLELSSPADLVVLVTNAGQGGERYAVYLKKDGLPSPDDCLAASEADGVEQLLDVPGATAGTYYVQVLYSSFSGNFWDSTGEYRILARRSGDLPLLRIGGAQAATIPMVGQSHYYRLEFPSPAELVLHLNNTGQAGERFAVYIKKDGLPSPDDCLAASEADGVEQLLDVPGATPGTYYVQVRYSSFTGNFWDAAGEYRIVGRPSTDLPFLALGEVEAGTIPMVGQSHYYRLTLSSPAEVVVQLSNAGQAGERFAVYIKKDGLPSPDDCLAASGADGVEQLLDVPGATAGTYYVQVRYSSFTGNFWDAAGEYRIVWQILGFAIAQVHPSRVGNAGTATLTILGAGLKDGATVKLARAGQADIVPLETTRVSASQVRACFDLRGAEPGMCDVVMTGTDGGTMTAPEAVEIIRGGEPQLWVDVVGGSSLRPGRPGTYLIRYGNSGAVDAHDVLLRVELPLEVEVVSTDLPYPNDEGIDWASVPISFDAETTRVVPIWLVHAPLGSNSFHLTVVATEGEAHQQAVIRAHLAQADSALARSGSLEDIGDSPIFLALAEAIQEVWAEQENTKDRKLIGQAKPSVDDVANWLRTGALVCLAVGAGAIVVGALVVESVVLGTGFAYGGVIAVIAAGAMGVADFKLRTDKRFTDRMSNSASAELWIQYIQPGDPNEKAGPGGPGAARFAVGDREFDYLVFFENVSAASAAAQEVLVVDQLDSNLDWSTCQLGETSLGGHIAAAPTDQHNLDMTIDLRPDLPALVDVTGTFDPESGRVEWLFRGRDPDTDELADFLPPNTDDVDPRGRGWVSYTVSPRPNLPTGTVIRNTATIDFEVGIPPEPLDTPEWINTIDAGPPSSAVDKLDATQTATDFEVTWSGQDDEGGSGIRDYTIYVAMDDGEYEVWLADTADTSATFTGEGGHTYKFYSRASDNVGHVELAPTEPDAETSVSIPPDDFPPVQSCGACGAGAPAAMIMGLCAIGLGKRRYHRRETGSRGR